MPEGEHPFWDEVAGRQPLPPASQRLGLRFLEAEPGSGRVRVEFSAGEEFTNPRGQIQGGFLAAMLDETLGAALAATLAAGEFAVTLELEVSFLRPVAPGAVVGEGRVTKRGRSVAFLEGSLLDPDGERLAITTARLLRSSPE